MAIIIISGALNIVAADASLVPKKKVLFRTPESDRHTHNVCCHGCRISMKRTKKKAVEYRGCLNCQMSFCGRASCPTGSYPFSEQGCVVCDGSCCVAAMNVSLITNTVLPAEEHKNVTKTKILNGRREEKTII